MSVKANLFKIYSTLLREIKMLDLVQVPNSGDEISEDECDAMVAVAQSIASVQEKETVCGFVERFTADKGHSSFIVASTLGILNSKNPKSKSSKQKACNELLGFDLLLKFSPPKQLRRMVLAPNAHLKSVVELIKKTSNDNKTFEMLKIVAQLVIKSIKNNNKSGDTYLWQKDLNPTLKEHLVQNNLGKRAQARFAQMCLVATADFKELSSLHPVALIMNSSGLALLDRRGRVYHSFEGFSMRCFGFELFKKEWIGFKHKDSVLVFGQEFFRSEFNWLVDCKDFDYISAEIYSIKSSGVKELKRVLKAFLKSSNLIPDDAPFKSFTSYPVHYAKLCYAPNSKKSDFGLGNYSQSLRINLSDLMKFVADNAPFAKDFVKSLKSTFLHSFYVSRFCCVDDPFAQKYIKKSILRKVVACYKIYLSKNGYVGKKQRFAQLMGDEFSFDGFIDAFTNFKEKS